MAQRTLREAEKIVAGLPVEHRAYGQEVEGVRRQYEAIGNDHVRDIGAELGQMIQDSLKEASFDVRGRKSRELSIVWHP